MSNSPIENPLAPPENPHLPNQEKKLKIPFSQEIFPVTINEEGKEEYQDPTVNGHIILVIIQLALVILAYSVLSLFANIKSNNWMQEFKEFNLEKTNQIIATKENSANQKSGKTTQTENTNKKNIATQKYCQAIQIENNNNYENTNNYIINPPERNRIIQQLCEIQSRAVMHYNIMIDFYETRYVAISMALSLASISVLCLIFISRSGWERVHKGIINIFVITTAFAVFYSDITNVYQHEENIAINEVQYESYTNLGNYIISYLITRNGIDGEEISPKNFIHKIDFIMEEINDIFLTFDNTSIDRRLKRISSVIPEANELPTDSENERQQPESENEE